MSQDTHVVDLRQKKSAPEAQEPAAPAKPVPVVWQAKEFSLPPSPRWLIGALCIAAGLIVWAVITLNFLFALFVGVAVLSLLMWGKKSFKIFDFQVDEAGVSINEQFWPHEAIESFWVFKFPETSLLSIRPRARFASQIRIPLPEKVETGVASMLRNYLPEEEERYTFVDYFADTFHF